MNQTQSRRLVGAIGMVQIAIIILVVVTALIHLQRAIGMGAGGAPGGFRGGAAGGFSGGPPGGFQPGAGGPRGGAPGGFGIMQMLPVPLPVLFLLNGLGYLALLVALYLPALRRYRRVVRWLLIGFAALTIVMYFLVSGFSLNPLGIADKAVEVALIALLLVEDRQQARAADAVG